MCIKCAGTYCWWATATAMLTLPAAQLTTVVDQLSAYWQLIRAAGCLKLAQALPQGLSVPACVLLPASQGPAGAGTAATTLHGVHRVFCIM